MGAGGALATQRVGVIRAERSGGGVSLLVTVGKALVIGLRVGKG